MNQIEFYVYERAQKMTVNEVNSNKTVAQSRIYTLGSRVLKMTAHKSALNLEKELLEI